MTAHKVLIRNRAWFHDDKLRAVIDRAYSEESHSALSGYTSRFMFAYVVRRMLLTLPVVWIVVTLVFALIHLVPGDPIAQMLGEGASVTEVVRLRHELGLDRPILDQYRTYLTDLAHGNLGVSFRDRQPVAKSIQTRYPATIELTIAALVLSILFAIPAGVI